MKRFYIKLTVFLSMLPFFLVSAFADEGFYDNQPAVLDAGKEEVEKEFDIAEFLDANDTDIPEEAVVLDSVEDKKKKNPRLYEPHRYFEVGIDVGGAFSNNYISAKKILVKDLVIDLPGMYSDLKGPGLLLNYDVNTAIYWNLNLKNGFHLGMASGVESFGLANISDDLFRFFGKGLGLGEKLSVSGNFNADVFAYTEVLFGFDLSKFHLEFVPSFFVPVFHAKSKYITGAFQNNTDGSFSAVVNQNMQIFSALNLDALSESDKNLSLLFDGFETHFGFDISAVVERQIFDFLHGAAYIRMPIVPGTMDSMAELEIQMEYKINQITDFFAGNVKDPSYTVKDTVHANERHFLHRPFRMGTEVLYQPFGKWCNFRNLIGFGVAYPWSSEPQGFFEYKLSTDINLANILGLDLSTAYLNRVFIHQVGIMLNFRVIEFNLGVSAQGGSFVSSFHGSGAGAYFTVKFGF